MYMNVILLLQLGEPLFQFIVFVVVFSFNFSKFYQKFLFDFFSLGFHPVFFFIYFQFNQLFVLTVSLCLAYAYAFFISIVVCHCVFLLFFIEREINVTQVFVIVLVVIHMFCCCIFRQFCFVLFCLNFLVLHFFPNCP